MLIIKCKKMASIIGALIPKYAHRISCNPLPSIFSRRTTSQGPSKDDPDRPVFDMTNPFTKETQKCLLCEHNIEVNYKNVRLLSQFQSSYTGRVYGRHITRLCKAQQQRVENEIIKAQSAGLMGTYTKDSAFLRDPKLFDPEKPFKPHRF